jgi:hypothetical protein
MANYTSTLNLLTIVQSLNRLLSPYSASKLEQKFTGGEVDDGEAVPVLDRGLEGGQPVPALAGGAGEGSQALPPFVGGGGEGGRATILPGLPLPQHTAQGGLEENNIRGKLVSW